MVPRALLVVAVGAAAVISACGSEATSGGSVPSAAQDPQATVPHQTLPLVPGTEPQVTPPSLVVPVTHAAPISTDASADPSANPSKGSAPVSGSIDPGLQPFIEMAVSDLAQRLDVDGDQIVVVSAELKTWPDSSIGCPQPGMQYTQVMTDGSLIVLEAAGKTFRYHSGGSRTPFLCEQ